MRPALTKNDDFYADPGPKTGPQPESSCHIGPAGALMGDGIWRFDTTAASSRRS